MLEDEIESMKKSKHLSNDEDIHISVWSKNFNSKSS